MRTQATDLASYADVTNRRNECRHCEKPIVRCKYGENNCLGWVHLDFGAHTCFQGDTLGIAEPTK